MLPSPQVRLARFEGTGFGQMLLPLFSDSLTRPSQLSLLLVAMGWVLSGREHRVASYLWRSGATDVKHFSSFYT